MAKKEIVKKIRDGFRLDGWKNILTGLGLKGSDRRTANEIRWDIMTEVDADELYAASDVARKIADEVVSEAFREGYELRSDSLNPDQLKAIKAEDERLQVNEKLQEAWKLARIYGGSAIIPLPKNIDQLSKPFIPASYPQFESLLVLSRWELNYSELELDIRSPNFGFPKKYLINPRTGADQQGTPVHHSWLIRFEGSYLPRIKFRQNNLWHDSILNVCRIPIRDYDAALAAVSATLDDFSVAVLKIKDLTRMVAEDRDDLVTKRLQISNLSRSIAKMIILDSENEEFQYQDRQLSGVADCVRMVAGRLVVASNMPHTKILGESPEGSNSTGNSTTKDWYDYVAAQQENYLDIRHMALRRALLATKKSPTGGQVPPDLQALYAPLWQEPESVQSTIRLQQAQTDQIYIAQAVLEPAEVAVSRFGSGKFSVNTQLVDDRDKAAAEQVKQLNDDPNGDKAKAEAAANALAQAKASGNPIGGKPGAPKFDPKSDPKKAPKE